MKGEHNGQPRKYRVDISGNVMQEVKELKALADTQGRAAEFLRALEHIIRRLRDAPADFGEIVKTLHHLKLNIHVGSVYPLTVRFACHETEPLVYIMKMFLA